MKAKWQAGVTDKVYTVIGMLSVGGNALVNAMVFYSTSKLAFSGLFGALINLEVLTGMPPVAVVLALVWTFTVIVFLCFVYFGI